MAMPVKAPPPPPPPPSWWSGFFEVVYNAGQVNPQGQAVYSAGDIQLIAGLNLSLYKDKAGFINNVSVGGVAIWDFATNLGSAPSGSLWSNLDGGGTQGAGGLYYILAADASVSFAQYWTLTDTFFFFSGDNAAGNQTNAANLHPGPVFSSAAPGVANCTWGANSPIPGANLGCLDLPAWYWNELKLSLNDGAITNWPISFNPYVIVYTELYPSGNSGWLGTTGSAACFSCNLQSTDFIIGMVPKLGLQPYIGLPITLSAPTWFTVGPQSFWNYNGLTNTTNAGTSSGNIGVFTTGLTASLAMTWIPAQYGHWNLKGGFQWYDIVNTALQGDNGVTYGSANPGQYIWTGFVGLGVGF